MGATSVLKINMNGNDTAGIKAIKFMNFLYRLIY